MQFEGELIQKPGEQVRPRVSSDVASNLVEQLYGLRVKSIKQLNSYEDKNFFVEVLQEHDNNNILHISRHGYTFKVLNALESKKPEYVVHSWDLHIRGRFAILFHLFHNDTEGQNALMTYLHQQGINCSVPVPNLQNKFLSLEKLPLDITSNDDEIQYSYFVVRLLTFVPGRLLCNLEYTPEILYKTGEYLAKLQEAMKDFVHDSFNKRITMWMMINVPELHKFLFAVKDDSNQDIVKDVINVFKQEVESRYNELPKGLLHGDYNEQNILVNVNASDTNKSYNFPNGIIDFADAQNSYYVFEISTAIMYMMLDSKSVDPMKVGGYILAGYTSIHQLSETEWEVLKTCVSARYCQSLVLGAFNSLLDPNNEYITITQKKGWTLLKKFWNIPKQKIYNEWKEIISLYPHKDS